eukprot:246419_1
MAFYLYVLIIQLSLTINLASNSIEDLITNEIDEWLNDDKVIEEYSNTLKTIGHFRLKNILNSHTTNMLSQQLLESSISHSNVYRNAWQIPTINNEYPLDHPINHMTLAKIGFIGRSDIPKIFVNIYEYKPILELFRKILSLKRNYKSLYLSTDLEGSIYGLIGSDTDEGGWHFDQHPFSCVWMLQKSLNHTGEFQYVYMPPIKHQTDNGIEFEWNFELLDNIHKNNETIFKTYVNRLSDINNGDVYCFEGNVTYHAVTPIYGDINRIVFVTTYSEIKNFQNSAEVNANNQWGKHKETVHREL